MSHVRGLTAIYRAGAELKKTPGFARDGEIQRPTRAVDHAVEHPQRILGVELRARVGGRVNDMRELAIRKVEVRDVSGQKGEAAMLGEVRSLPPEGVDASSQDCRSQP